MSITIGLGIYQNTKQLVNPQRVNTAMGEPAVTYPGSNGYNALRGLIAAEDDLTKTLVFQFNPDTMSETKASEYADRKYPGLPFKAYIWSSGGDRVLSFQLFMDATAATNNPQFRKNVGYGNASIDDLAISQPRGTLDRVELLTSFLYPRLKANSASESLPVPLFTQGGIVPENQFLPPPVAIFCYGGYYLRGFIRDVTTTHELFNKDLYPVRSRCDVNFTVLEQTSIIIDPNVKLKATSALSVNNRAPITPTPPTLALV
jgi:hypothetical protein